MRAYERLSAVFDQGLSKGIDSLSPNDREWYRIQEFIIEYEMGGLTSYFYNRLPDLDSIGETVAAMRKHGVAQLALLLGEAAELFRAYVEPNSATSWNDLLRQYDPTNRLDQLHEAIGALNDYGLNEAAIS